MASRDPLCRQFRGLTVRLLAGTTGYGTIGLTLRGSIWMTAWRATSPVSIFPSISGFLSKWLAKRVQCGPYLGCDATHH